MQILNMSILCTVHNMYMHVYNISKSLTPRWLFQWAKATPLLRLASLDIANCPLVDCLACRLARGISSNSSKIRAGKWISGCQTTRTIQLEVLMSSDW